MSVAAVSGAEPVDRSAGHQLCDRHAQGGHGARSTSPPTIHRRSAVAGNSRSHAHVSRVVANRASTTPTAMPNRTFVGRPVCARQLLETTVVDQGEQPGGRADHCR